MSTPHPAVSCLEQLGSTPTFAEFCEHAAPLLRDWATRGDVHRWIRHALAATLMPARELGGHSDPSALAWDGPWGTLTIVPAPDPSDVPNTLLTGSPSHRLLVAVGASLPIMHYCHVRAQYPTILDRTNRLVAGAVQLCEPGQPVALEAWRDVVQLMEGRGLWLVLHSRPVYSVRWVYDRASLEPRAMVVASRRLARTEELIEVLAQIGDSRDVGILEQLAGHQCHSIRWASIRAVAALDMPTARRLIVSALDDPHPEVRETARASADALDESPHG